MLTRVNKVMHKHLYGVTYPKDDYVAPGQSMTDQIERQYLDLDWLDQSQHLRGHIDYRVWSIVNATE